MASRVGLVAAVGLACLGGLAALHFTGADRPALRALGLEAGPTTSAFPDAAMIDWPDLIPPDAASRAQTLPDGTAPRGLIQHGELGPLGTPASSTATGAATPPELAQALGAMADMYSPPRRLSDALGGIGNLRALQPPGGEVRADLDGKDVRIAGFVAPLAFRGDKITDFLLVPYVGACIHVPPPPANQIVLVAGGAGFRPDSDLLYPVWVTGRLRAVSIDTDLAKVGYQIEGAEIEPY